MEESLRDVMQGILYPIVGCTCSGTTLLSFLWVYGMSKTIVPAEHLVFTANSAHWVGRGCQPWICVFY